jgi:hypothetical protein
MGEAHDVDLLPNLILQSAVWAEILSTACPVKEIMGTYYFRYCPLVGNPPMWAPSFWQVLAGGHYQPSAAFRAFAILIIICGCSPYQECALSGGTAHEKKIRGLEAIAQEYPR